MGGLSGPLSRGPPRGGVRKAQGSGTPAGRRGDCIQGPRQVRRVGWREDPRAEESPWGRHEEVSGPASLIDRTCVDTTLRACYKAYKPIFAPTFLPARGSLAPPL